MTRSRVIGLTAITIVLIACTMLGSVLVNVEWPDGPLTWLRVALGAVLLTFSLLCTELLIRVVRDSRRPSRDGRTQKTLELLDRFIAAMARPRRVAAVLVLAVVWLVVAYLAPPVFSTPRAVPEFEPGELVMMSAIDESPSDPRQVLIRQWNYEHPRNRVTVRPVSGEPDVQHGDMVDAANGDEQIDVYLLDVVWMTEFIENGYIRPLDETGLKTDDFIDNVLDLSKDGYRGREGLWALPLNTDAGLIFYRDDLTSAPISWDDVLGGSARTALAAARQEPGASPGLVAANAAQLENEEVLTVTALEAMWAAGGEVVNTDGQPVFNHREIAFDDNARLGLEKLATAYHDRSITHSESGEMDEGKAANAFKDGQTLYMRNWPVMYDNLTSATDKGTVSFGVARLPGHSVLGGQNLSISSRTKNAPAAQAFIEFLTSPASELLLFEAGGFAPTRNSAYDDSTRPYKDMLRGAVVDARPRPFLPNYTEFSKELRKGLIRALNNGGVLEEDFPKELAKKAR
ncbi:extracellular solute-binding protein [Actinophytocola oryzae]|uniref:extracellular solute-binding protein n=1 Tax=Actinophytocola oryzae TaxID=502181 RepID=UPI00106300EA|nr:extracellular solute-binding protein [Actinophytocola oryzae]